MQSPRIPMKVQRLKGRVAILSCFVLRARNKCLPFFDALRGEKGFKWNDKYKEAF